MGAEIVDPAGWRRSVFPAMGTTVSVLLPVASASLAGLVIHLFAEWEERLSRFRATSELALLNAEPGRPRRVSRLLFDAVATAVEAAAATGGLFDPTLLDRLEALGYDRTFDALRRHTESGRHPGRDRVDGLGAAGFDRRPPASEGVHAGGWRRIRLDRRSRTIELPPGVRLDLGGIAKGMAVDAAIAVLRSAGAAAAAVEAGGDLAVFGAPPDGDAWRIGVDPPAGGRRETAVGRDRNVRPTSGSVVAAPAPVLALSTGALATSSVERRRWFLDGRWHHHLLDPRTGDPAVTGIRSATVAAPSCTEAEVAAKVALLLGPEAGPAVLRASGYGGLLIDDAGRWILVEPTADHLAANGPGHERGLPPRTTTDVPTAGQGGDRVG